MIWGLNVQRHWKDTHYNESMENQRHLCGHNYSFSWKFIEDSSLYPVVDTSCPLFETAATTRKNFVTDSSTAAEGIEKCCPARCHDEPFTVSVPFQPAVFYWNILWIFPCSNAHLRSGFEL